MPDALDLSKRELRDAMGSRRRRVSAEHARRAAERVVAQLLEAPELVAAGQVGLYAALSDELPSHPCFEALRSAGKPCLLPRQSGRRLEFCRVERWDELRPGRYGVSEPPLGLPASVFGPGDLVLVPGVAFDGEGNRLGRGGGAYDASFPPGEAGGVQLFGLAYAFQLVDRVPHGSRDRRVDAIVTENGVHRVRRGAHRLGERPG